MATSPEPVALEGLKAHVVFKLTLYRLTGFQQAIKAFLGGGDQGGGWVRLSCRGRKLTGTQGEHCASCPGCVGSGGS